MTNANDSINNSEQGPQDGLTKREYFAAMALQSVHINSSTNTPIEIIAKQSVELADALIESLNKIK